MAFSLSSCPIRRRRSSKKKNSKRKTFEGGRGRVLATGAIHFVKYNRLDFKRGKQKTTAGPRSYHTSSFTSNLQLFLYLRVLFSITNGSHTVGGRSSFVSFSSLDEMVCRVGVCVCVSECVCLRTIEMLGLETEKRRTRWRQESKVRKKKGGKKRKKTKERVSLPHQHTHTHKHRLYKTMLESRH